jgi:hypothetical protein
MPIDWSLAGGNNALANFGYGMQIGQKLAERREKREYQNALATVFARPTPPRTPGFGDDPLGNGVPGDPTAPNADNGEAMSVIARNNPELAYRIGRERAEAASDAHKADVMARAARGDPAALAELAGLDFNAWRGLSADQRTAAGEKMKVLGNAALDVLNRPPEQRAAVWDAYIGQLSQQMPELAQYAGKYSEQAARSVVAQAEMMGKLHELEQPDLRVIPEGGALVNVGDPAAVQQYMQGLGNVPPPPAGFQLDNPGGGAGNGVGGFPGN